VRGPVNYLDLADFLIIAEAVLGVQARELAHVTKLDLAESALAAPSATFEGLEFYPTFAEKAAVLCSRLIRNHTLPDGNKRVGYLCLVEFAERNGYRWKAPEGDEPEGDETVAMIEGVASGQIDEPALVRWIEKRLVTPS
jgi:death-on-curing protein